MRKATMVLLFLAGPGFAVVGVDSGLTSLYVSGNEIYATNATNHTIRVFQFSAPSELKKINLSGITEQEPVFISLSSPYAYVLNRRSGTLQAFIFDEDFILPLGSVPTGFEPVSGFFRSPYVFVANSGSNTLQAFDTSCNNRPMVAAQARTGSIPTSVNLDGKYAFVTCLGAKEDGNPGTGIFQAFSIGKMKWGIALSGSAETDAGPVASFVSSPNAFVVNTIANTLQSFNISNPAGISKLGSVGTSKGSTAVAGNGNLIYVTCRLDNALEIFDVSDPANMRLIIRLATDFGPTAVVVYSPYAYVACYRSLQIFDVSDPLRKPPFLAASASAD